MIPTNPDISSAQSQRLRDSLRLAQTRQQNLEESIKRLRSLQEKLYRHQKLSSDLDINMKQLFALNKECASLSEEATEMDRFETFESIMAPFLKMQLMDSEAEDSRRMGQDIEKQVRALVDEMDNVLKQQSASKDSINLAEAQHQELCAKVEECGQHDGACHILEENIREMEEKLTKEEDHRSDIQGHIMEITSSITELEDRLEMLQGKRHLLESHETMLEKGEVILGMLHRLEELAENMHGKAIQLDKNNEELIRTHEDLVRIKSLQTGVEQQIQSLQDEIGIHRLNIQDKQSYETQERVMKLKSRILMLSAAESLWKRISSGYYNIELKKQLINSLRLEIEHDMKAEQSLAIEVKNLKRQTADKEYTLNMSKSQSLISLRADLVEGTACPVCGANHHPYHSDTMQDQYKLISDFQSELEILSGDLQGQERQLTLLHDKLTKNLGQQVAEQTNLDAISLRQEEDVREWRVFTQLDPTFADCSASTDSDARMASIRQLQDNAKRDLQRAEEELSELNYHTSQITFLSEKIAGLENRKTEIIQQVNETNSQSCILAAQNAKLDNSRKMAQEKYHRQYELLQNEITLPEWFKLWQNNPETLYIDIRKMVSDWNEINRNIDSITKSLAENNIRRELYNLMLSRCKQEIEEIKENVRKHKSKANELATRRQNLLQKDSIGAVLDASLRNYQQALEEHSVYTQHLHKLALEKKEKEGSLISTRKTGESLDKKANEQRNMVDLWIRAYNAEHPPVQYAELQTVFTKNIDWNQKRNRIRENRLAISLQQQKVKELQSEIIALEVDTGPLSNTQLYEKQLSTETQIQQQEASLREVSMQIARLQIELGI